MEEWMNQYTHAQHRIPRKRMTATKPVLLPAVSAAALQIGKRFQQELLSCVITGCVLLTEGVKNQCVVC